MSNRVDQSGARERKMGGDQDNRRETATRGGTKVRYFDADALLDDYVRENPTRNGKVQALPYIHLVTSPSLVMTRGRVRPNHHVPPHRHGVAQVTYVLEGELHYGNRIVKAGGGVFTPDTKYSWTSGPEGAEILEIFNGIPQPGSAFDSGRRALPYT